MHKALKIIDDESIIFSVKGNVYVQVQERSIIMADCELLDSCPFFNETMKSMPASAEQFKKNYCRGDNSICARFMVYKALGREKVPANLFPNQVDKAKDLIG